MQDAPKIMIIGGEASGDRYGAELVMRWQSRWPEAVFFGLGGEHMRRAGVHLLYDMSQLTSIGVVDSFKGAHLLKRLVQRVGEAMERQNPDVFVQVGLPVFSFRLLELASCKGIPVVYYCSPLGRGFSVKAKQFLGKVHHVLSISETETSVWKAAGVPVTFVGHPAVDLTERPSAVTKIEGNPVITVAPGARNAEMRRMLPAIARALVRVKEQYPNMQVVLSLAPTADRPVVKELIRRRELQDVTFVDDMYSALVAGDLAIVNVGTASLEAALLGVPAIAVHKRSAAGSLLEQVFDRRPNKALANVLLEDSVVPELTGSNFTDGKIAKTIVQLLGTPEKLEEMKNRYNGLAARLGGVGAVKRAADFVADMIEHGGS